MVELSDDELGVIFRSISEARDRTSISLVCKQWHRVEDLTRTSMRLLAPNYLLKLLPRFPNLTTFESSTVINDVNVLCLVKDCPKIETLNLNLVGESSSDDISDVGLHAIGKWCRNLSVLLLQNRKSIGDAGVFSLLRFSCNLIRLDLSGCTAVTDQGLLTVEFMGSLESLSLQGCSLITDKGLAMLLSKNIRKLNVSGCNQITDLGVFYLSKIVSLEELNLADCGSGITELGGLIISRIPSLKKLDLSRLNVADLTLLMVAEGCKSLVEVSINGCSNIAGHGISGFAAHKSLEVFMMGSCDAVSIESIKNLVLGCMSLKYIELDKKLRTKISLHMQEIMNSVCLLNWIGCD